ncbi:MAG: hypothetical protein LBH85_10585 [Treponema sp.]|nr:hypothetical protein [Treponema sp.]
MKEHAPAAQSGAKRRRRLLKLVVVYDVTIKKSITSKMRERSRSFKWKSEL